MTDLGRRRFLAGTGCAAGLFAGCRPRQDPYAPQKPPVPLGKGVRLGAESFVVSTCGMCDAGCSVRVRVVDGRAVRIEGNPESPASGSGLCARGLAGLQMLYHPDRVRGPMRRRGGRGENQWQPVTWDAAVAELADRLGKLRAAGSPQGLVLIDGQSRGNTHALWGRFMAAFGSPNHIGHGATGRAALVEPLGAMTGMAGMPGYDFEHAACVLLVGTGPLEASSQAIRLSRALARDARPRLFCVSPRLPRAAALVDEWFQVRPGQAAALLLGLVHVLLREQLADESLLNQARGFEAMSDLVMTEYSPGEVADATGVAAERIEALARELVAVRPSVVVVDEETKDRRAVAAALILNAALSSIDAPGGLWLEREEPAGWPAPELDPVAQAGAQVVAIDGRGPGQRGFDTSRILAVPDAILSGKPYPAHALLLHYSNPVFSKPDGQRWAETVAKVPFVVSFSPIADESVRFADLVLPDPTYLERWDLLPTGQGVWSLRQPVVAPLGDSLQTGEVLLRLARALGGTVDKSLPWKTYRDAVLARLEALAPDRSEELLDDLADKGTCLLAERSERSGGNGAWSGMLHLSPALLRSTSPTGAAPADLPFVLWPLRDHRYGEGGFRQLPYLAELPSGSGNPWEGGLEIAPDDARRLGVEDGDWVKVTSPVGRVELRARIHAGIRPKVLGLPLGGWGRRVGEVDQMPSRLLAGLADPATGQWIAWGTFARLEKIG
jgi:menaquinone reductase, molybdopterin-binding-like subunit